MDISNLIPVVLIHLFPAAFAVGCAILTCYCVIPANFSVDYMPAPKQSDVLYVLRDCSEKEREQILEIYSDYQRGVHRFKECRLEYERMNTENLLLFIVYPAISGMLAYCHLPQKSVVWVYAICFMLAFSVLYNKNSIAFKEHKLEALPPAPLLYSSPGEFISYWEAARGTVFPPINARLEAITNILKKENDFRLGMLVFLAFQAGLLLP